MSIKRLPIIRHVRYYWHAWRLWRLARAGLLIPFRSDNEMLMEVWGGER